MGFGISLWYMQDDLDILGLLYIQAGELKIFQNMHLIKHVEKADPLIFLIFCKSYKNN